MPLTFIHAISEVSTNQPRTLRISLTQIVVTTQLDLSDSACRGPTAESTLASFPPYFLHECHVVARHRSRSHYPQTKPCLSFYQEVQRAPPSNSPIVGYEAGTTGMLYLLYYSL